MKDTKVLFKWREENQEHRKLIDRNEMYFVFSGLEKGFHDDNVIAKKILKVLPYIDSVEINKDRNANMDAPFIVCVQGEKKEVIKIIRYHKIIWAILDKYCTE